MKRFRKKCLLKSLVVIACALLHVYIYTLIGNSLRLKESFVKRFRFNGSFVSAITAVADADRCIVLAMVDKGFIDMAINFHEASLQAHRVDNFLFVGVGRKACEILTNLSIPCFYYADDPNADKASSYGQLDFNRKVNMRTDMILEALAAGLTVIHTDTDVSFLSNPLSEIKVCLISCPIAMAYHGTDYKMSVNMNFNKYVGHCYFEFCPI